jgi:methionyl-tRNA synthetase
VPVPWDPKHVVYVWVDALLNYITAVGFGADQALFDSVWPADVHLIGKDITRFHAVIWPAMLMAADVAIPRHVFAHGFLNMGGEKMSKTRGTVVHPDEVTSRFGVDAYRYYLMREVQFGQDGNFSFESLTARYNAELANGLGNLASRVLTMVGSNFDGLVPEPSRSEPTGSLAAPARALSERYQAHMADLDLTSAVGDLDEFVRQANHRLAEVAPWKMAKDPERRADLGHELWEALEALRLIAVFASPIMPAAAERLWEQLGIAEPLSSQRLPEAGAWGLLAPGTKTQKGESLFPRIDG